VTQLAWNIIEFGDAMSTVNELTEAKEVLRWAADFLIASHPRSDVFVGQLGSSTIDFEYFVSHLRSAPFISHVSLRIVRMCVHALGAARVL
jgi:hypothetical protein